MENKKRLLETEIRNLNCQLHTVDTMCEAIKIREELRDKLKELKEYEKQTN